jgi:hypothetical protein
VLGYVLEYSYDHRTLVVVGNKNPEPERSFRGVVHRMAIGSILTDLVIQREFE